MINLTTIFAVLLSSVCQAVLIIFELNNVQDGILLLVTLRDCLWMHPMIYLLFAPKVACNISAKMHPYIRIHIHTCIYSKTQIVQTSIIRRTDFSIIQ